MADLATSGVSILRTSSASLSNGLTMYQKACSVTLSTMGTATNKVLATAFGLSSFEESSAWVKSDNTEVIPAGVSNDRTYLLLKAAGTAAPADTSGVYTCYVKGY